jgi:hypothetical protein
MKRAWLVLTARQAATFSASAATAGGHDGLSHVPGANLLGWAASRLYSQLSADEAFTAFHSGKLRFGNAYPRTKSESAAYPRPACWFEKKRERGGIVDNGEGKKIAEVRNYQFLMKEERFSEQAEVLEDVFVAPDGTVASPNNAYVMKTAIESGTNRAKEAALFGYNHIPPQDHFASVLEADDDVSDKLFEIIRVLFENASGNDDGIRLGRSAKAEFGGDFYCSAQETGPAPWSRPLPCEERPDILNIWCLSDVALVDPETGAPALAPEPETLGLPQAGKLCQQKSFIGTRRYAPYNNYLGARDVERLVITAGSVLCFQFEAPLTAEQLAPLEAGIGLYRECGLGRVWANPPCLSTPAPDFSRDDSPRITIDGHIGEAPWPSRDAIKAYVPRNSLEVAELWAQKRLIQARAETEMTETVERWKGEIEEAKEALRALARTLPTANQWSQVASACQASKGDPDELKRRLFEDRNCICRDNRGDAWDRSINWAPSPWKDGEKVTLADVLQGQLDTTPRTVDLTRVLEQVARRQRHLMTREAEAQVPIPEEASDERNSANG